MQTEFLDVLIDTHLHLDKTPFQADLAETLQRARDAGIVQMITIGCGIESSKRALQLASDHKEIFAALGVHPHDAGLSSAEEIEIFEELLSHPKALGVGETGLDYFYKHSSKEDQEASFRRMIRLSFRRDLPLIIHSRDAEADTLRILEDEAQGRMYRGVIHCFSGTQSFAEACLALGFYLSIPGMITFVKPLQAVVKTLPLSRLLVETDAPYLAPLPHRGKRNEPSFVRYTALELARLLQRPFAEVAEKTTANARELFRLPREAP